MRILALTNLFPSAWDPLRASFNRQQFDRLAAHHDLEVMVAVDFRERRRGRRGAAPVLAHARTSEFTFWYPPRVGRSLHGLAWYASLMAQHGRRLARERHDLLLASWAYPDAVGTARLARRLGLPYVVKVHGSDLNVQANYRLRRSQIAAALRGARAVVAVSDALAGKVRELGVDPRRVHLIYNGVDSERFRPGDRAAARGALGLPNDAPIVLYVGNLKQAKGCLDLLEAFPQVLARHPRALLAFVGDGPAAAALMRRARELGIDDQVQLAGARPHEQLAQWMQAASLLSLPSHNEGVPNVVLEAMACGLPVVATRVGGIPEVLPEQAGLLVPAHDRAALGEALDEALRRNWLTDAILDHASHFRWDDNVRQLDRIVREAAGAPQP
ncbi:MAG TPA: glycosyltransferase family 4 protein [Luteimonas sp.]|nr:glycosyltransferase family 4 protein [Luteimonas sp.]HRO26164.1 glycosyltransferase family 4 protein [Luteimonas sp.]HRP73221.1 glycosyltransferase family 4 protein [Luteimonas sp.]